MWRMLGADHPIEAHRIDSRCIYARARGRDVREGISAFLEKSGRLEFEDLISRGHARILSLVARPPLWLRPLDVALPVLKADLLIVRSEPEADRRLPAETRGRSDGIEGPWAEASSWRCAIATIGGVSSCPGP